MSTYTPSPPPYRVPPGPSEGQRLMARWSSFSRLVKSGIVGGGLLTLVAVGAIAAPLVTATEPPKHLPFGLTSEVRTSPAAGNKVAEPSHPATTVASTEPVKVPTSATPTQTTKAPEPTKAPSTTKAPEPTKATTTKATEPVKTSTPPVPTTPAPTTQKPTTPSQTTSTTIGKPIVTAGAICTVSGAQGVTSTGAAMVCKTTTTDTTLRWRAA